MSKLDLTEREVVNHLQACADGRLSGLLREWPLVIRGLRKVGCWLNPLENVRHYQNVCKVILDITSDIQT